MNVDLHYGTGVVSLRVPDANVQEIIRPWHGGQTQNAAGQLRETLARQAGTFSEEVAGKRVCVLIDDGSRDEPRADVLPPICGLLRPAASVQFIICTGTHIADTPKNVEIRREVEKVSLDAGLTLTSTK